MTSFVRWFENGAISAEMAAARIFFSLSSRSAGFLVYFSRRDESYWSRVGRVGWRKSQQGKREQTEENTGGVRAQTMIHPRGCYIPRTKDDSISFWTLRGRFLQFRDRE